MFQVMGFNYNLCGYLNVSTFIQDMRQSETKHLDAAIGYLKKVNGLMAAMKQGYDTKLREADMRYIQKGYR
jgi:hypothetical protein